ncbi:hypothetical protein K7432_000783 [Basidiobolus ranarum]|uniref:CHCH domain-containing protein n=1 Tax=Basidiobolus ranarum TaxID=34480 RepID=A0ABR2X3Z1_9FUNG
MKLKYLKVKPRKVIAESPCVAEVTMLLNCWSSFTPDNPKCAESAKAVMMCMKNSPNKPKKPNTINYHLARLGKLL